MASQMQEPITQTAGQVARQAGDTMDQAVDMAKQQTASRLDTERERIAESLYTTAHALRQVSQQLREQEQEGIASIADRTAQRVEQASGYLRSRQLPDLVDDTEQLGRTHPMLFAGGALGLGLLGIRFLKSSRRQQQATAQAQPNTYPLTSTTNTDLPVAVDDVPGITIDDDDEVIDTMQMTRETQGTASGS